jgi:hypothetical protein
MAAPNYKILGKGTFGAVIAPALPNIDVCGNPMTFGNGYVTKVMFDETDYVDALAATKQIARNVPSLAQNIQPYRRKISDAMLSAIPGMDKYIEEIHPHHNRIYALRMPNLGFSLYDITFDKTEGPTNMRRRLREWTNEELCQQILKLMRIVRDIHDVGYVHADIRETNVMCNLDTKDFTIVDFDWFMKTDDFLMRYPNYFYAHPPESIFMLHETNEIDGIRPLYKDGIIPSDDEFRERIGNNVNIYLDVYKDWIDYFLKSELNPTIESTADFAQNLKYTAGYLRELVTEHGVAKGERLFQEKYFATMDSYGLAVSLIWLLYYTLIQPYQMELHKFLVEDLLPHMMHFQLKHRATIHEAIVKFETYLAEHMPTVKAELDMEDEIQRLRAISPDVIDVPMPKQRRLSSARRSEVRKQVEAYAALVGALEGIRIPSASKPNMSGLRAMMRSPSGRTASSSARRKTSSNSKKKSNAKPRSTRKKSPK